MKIDLDLKDRIQADWITWPLKIDRVLYEAEQPLVFMTRSTSGQSLLAYLAHESATGIYYILATASPRKIQHLEQGAIGVREALCADWMWILRRDTETSTFDVWSISEEKIPDEYLPVPGTGLISEHSVVFSARALGDGVALGKMPCSVISLVAESARSSLKAIFDFVCEANTEGRPTDAQRALYDLPVKQLRFASFEVGLGEPNPALFTDDVLQKAISRLTHGLEWAQSSSNDDFLREQSQQEQEVVLRATLALTPPSCGVVSAIEVSGTWLGGKRFHLDRNARSKVGRRLRTLRTERIVVFSGRIGEIDDDNLSFILREANDGVDHKGAFPEELLDDMRTHYYEANRVEMSGVELNGRLRVTAIVQLPSPSQA